MKSATQGTAFFGAAGRKAVAVLGFVSLLGAMSMSPAFADPGHGRGGPHANNGQRDHGQRGWHGDRHDGRHVYRRPYVYAQPVYVPPPVYYEPRQSPGISLFFPLDLRR